MRRPIQIAAINYGRYKLLDPGNMCERRGGNRDLSLFLQRDSFEDSGGIYASVELRDNLRTTAGELSPWERLFENNSEYKEL